MSRSLWKRILNIENKINNLTRVPPILPPDPAEFAHKILNIKTTSYQTKLLRTTSKRVILRWARQTGKTTVLACLCIHHAALNPHHTVLVVAPGLRQSMILGDKIRDLISRMPRDIRRSIMSQQLRTIFRLRNWSQIIVLPNSENQLRGFTAHLIVCLPQYTRIALAEGKQIPINEIISGCRVLSFNIRTGEVEPKEVVSVYRNPLQGRGLLQVKHEKGILNCTPEHKIFTLNRGYIQADQLDQSKDKLIYLEEEANFAHPRERVQQIPIQIEADSASRTDNTRRVIGRFFGAESRAEKKKHMSEYQSFLEASRICTVQVLDVKGFCIKSTEDNKEQRVGEGTHAFPNTRSSSLHRNASPLLSKWKEDSLTGVAYENQPSNWAGGVVHGRWRPGLPKNHDDQLSRIWIRREYTSPKMAERPLGNRFPVKKGCKGEGILHMAASPRERQILPVDKGLYHSKHELQNSTRNPFSYMQNMWEKISCSKKHRIEGKILLERLFKNRTSKALLQSSAYQLCHMWKRIRPTCREKNHLQPSVQQHKLSKIQESLQTRRVKTSSRHEMCNMWTNIHSKKATPKILFLGMQEDISQKTSDDEKVVYNLEIKDNNNFFADGVLVSNCDEAAFFHNDEEIFHNILPPMLATTGGTFVVSSTPWGKNTVFYQLNQDPDYEKHIVTWRDAQAEKRYSPEFLEQIKKEQESRPQVFRMEYEAEFIEEVDTWLGQDLLAKSCDAELEFLDFESEQRGHFFAGVDLAEHVDHSAVAIIDVQQDIISLRHAYRFRKETSIASVIGYLKILNTRWSRIQAIYVDKTKHGDYVIHDMHEVGLQQAEGITFTQDSKQEMAQLLKQRMQEGLLRMPFSRDLLDELNTEKYELTKTGRITLSHPDGTHDDQFWALALAVYAAEKASPTRTIARAY